jgi:tetratricopeptide (TPR) repeat protein
MSMDETDESRRRWGQIVRGLALLCCLAQATAGSAAQESGVQRRLESAHESLASGRVDRAEREARHLLEEFPGNADIHRFMCELRQVQARYEEALDACRRAAQLAPTRIEFQNYIADLLTQRESGYDEAIRVYMRVAALDPTSAGPYVSIGSLLERTERLIEAEAAYREALGLNPNTVGAAAGLGAVLFKTDRLEEARRYLLRAIELRPRDLRSHIYLGLSLNHTGQYDLALQELRSAATIDPHAANAVAGVREQYPRFERLRGYYLAEMEKDDRDAAVWHHIAVLSYFLRDYETAWRHLVRAQLLDYPVDLGFKEVVYSRWKRLGDG